MRRLENVGGILSVPSGQGGTYRDHAGRKTRELGFTVRNVKSGHERHGYTYQSTEKLHRTMKLSHLLGLLIQKRSISDEQ